MELIIEDLDYTIPDLDYSLSDLDYTIPDLDYKLPEIDYTFLETFFLEPFTLLDIEREETENEDFFSDL